jgi:hypothetical protein
LAAAISRMSSRFIAHFRRESGVSDGVRTCDFRSHSRKK